MLKNSHNLKANSSRLSSLSSLSSITAKEVGEGGEVSHSQWLSPSQQCGVEEEGKTALAPPTMSGQIAFGQYLELDDSPLEGSAWSS